ncbi:MAG: hypothetical protein ACE5HU_01785 [Acidobacteriota bacterium]
MMTTARREAASGPLPAEGRARLERVLISLYRSEHRPRRRRGRHRSPEARLVVARQRPARVTAVAPPAAGQTEKAPEPSAAVLEELLARLGAIETKLSQLSEWKAASPATREAFSEWVRLRRWEEMPFAEFLKLRRAGRL